jgi:glycosyltransferase involved in cell wall biosynthesis
MRIAFLGDASMNHVRRWAGFFHERGHDVLLLSFEETSDCPVFLRRIKTFLPTKLLGYFGALARVKKELAIFRPDLVNALYAGGYGFIGALSRFRPLVVSALGSDLLVDYPSSLIHKKQIEFAVQRADLVTVDADVLTGVLLSMGMPREKILKAYFGIDEAAFHPAPNAAVSRGAGRPYRIVSTRNLYDVYNVELLIDAAPLVLEQVPADFVVCGEGPLRKSLERRAAALGMERHVIFRGRIHTAEIAEELRMADVYVSTSRSDSTSVSLLEAMACGVPPVVTDLEANREWITDGENGLLFQPGDPASLARSIVRILTDGPFSSRIRETNTAIVRERGLWNSNMETIEQSFLMLVAGDAGTSAFRGKGSEARV